MEEKAGEEKERKIISGASYRVYDALRFLLLLLFIVVAESCQILVAEINK